MYDPQGYYVPNALKPFHLAAWMPLQYNPDGSLDLYIQASSPGAEKKLNWLPAPAKSAFNLVGRDFWPKEPVVDDSYKEPPVKKVPGKPRRHAATSRSRDFAVRADGAAHIVQAELVSTYT